MGRLKRSLAWPREAFLTARSRSVPKIDYGGKGYVIDLQATRSLNRHDVIVTSGPISLLDMLKRYAFSFYEAIIRAEQLRTEARIWASSTIYAVPKNTEEPAREQMVTRLQEIRTECASLGLTHTASLISFAESEVQRKGNAYTYVDMLKELDTVLFSFAEELRRNSCFRIAAEKDKYFEKETLFGEEVNNAFGKCIGDIQAAGTCYALEQNEACGFHSMRVLEHGLGALAKKFGVDFSHTNWHNVIELIEKQIRKMDSTFGHDWKEQQKFCSQAATHFMFLKDAWRNHVMHIRDVPYDEGTAFSVLDHVRQFMQSLAKGGLTE